MERQSPFPEFHHLNEGSPLCRDCGSHTLPFCYPVSMVAKPYWLIGVRRDELTPRVGPAFLNELKTHFDWPGLNTKALPSIVRNIPAPKDVFDLQRTYGTDFVEFYYVDEPLVKAAASEDIKLNRLQLVVGLDPYSDILTVIRLPQEFSD